MGIKRKRPVKNELPSSDDLDASTHEASFINNSDYASEESNRGFGAFDDSENPFLEPKHNGVTNNKDQQTKENDNIDENSELDAKDTQDRDIQDTVKDIDTNTVKDIQDTVKDLDSDTVKDIPYTDTLKDLDTDTVKDLDTDTVKDLDTDTVKDLDTDTVNDRRDSDGEIFVDARGSGPASPSVKNAPVLQPSLSLSYSQQQSDVLLQSPSKRRDIQFPVRPNEPRIMIDKLVLTNFKSYAGTQVIGPFNASFSAVVGPNGSGKSNVIDSMLFVFGFRASKMRQSKLSELIHNSSGGKKYDFCRVDIHFQYVMDDAEGDKPAQVIGESELVISRQANRNNSSQYYVNGKPSNYTEVTTYLKEKGIDLDHKRFLILQGEVESIAQMKAKAEKENDDGLLEYLEDIIGTSKYKQLIEDNTGRMYELNEVCLEKENRFELVEKDKDQLEEKKNEALRYLSIEKKLVGARSIQHHVNMHENQTVLAKHEEGLQALKEELATEREANAELARSMEEFYEKQKSIKEGISELNAKTTILTKRRREVNKQNVALDEQSKNLSSKIKKLTKSKESSEHALSTATSSLKVSSQASEQYQQEMKELSSSLDVEKARLDEIRKGMTEKTSGITAQIAALQTKLSPWTDKLKENENATSLAKSALEMLTTQKYSTEKQLASAKERLIGIKTEGKSKEAAYREAETNLATILDQIALGKEQCELEKEELEKKRAQASIARERAQEAAKSLSNFENKNKVLSSLLRLAKSGRINGFHGRLGDLGVIDDKYDIAISTACPGLDSMVVETVETAQACIDYLRKNKLGYANFICLNKLRQFNLGPIQTPGDPSIVKRLFDLVRPNDAKFAPAFYSKMYNTLVAPDLREAKKVAYGPKRWKVVTLDGKVVDTSGAMSGGGNYHAKGAMRTTNSTSEDAMDISPDDVNLMWEDVRRMEQELDAAKQKYAVKEDMLQKLMKLKPDTEFSLSRLQLDIKALSAEKKEVSATCRALMAESEDMGRRKQIDSQIRAKEAEVAALEESHRDLKSQMKELEAQIQAYEAKIMDAGGVELKVQNSKVDSIKQKMEIIDQKTAGDRMAIRKLENDIKRHQKVIATTTEDLETCQQMMSKVQADQRALAQTLEELDAELRQHDDKKNELESEMEAIRVELEDKSEQLNKFKSFEIEMENKMEKHHTFIARARRNIEDSQRALDELVVRDVKPYIDWMSEEEQEAYGGSAIEEVDEETIKEIDLDDINTKIENLEASLSSIAVDIEVLKEYGLKKSEYESRRSDLNAAVGERDEVKNYCEELKRKRLDEFMEGFNTISMTLKDMYRMITMGGNAELELVDSLDPFSEGILFSVMPPKKSWRNISNLSGGEKTLSSLALVFALHQYKPTPLYVMDEIDAALDFRNVSIVANYIKERTKNAQFIVISLRNNMFELSQQLVGIYKVNNQTKSISLKNKSFVGIGTE